MIVVSYGGGVNSVALLVQLARLGQVPKAIVMADPGSERRGTIDFRDNVLPAWLDSHGFPRVTVIDRITQGQGRPRTWRLETLRDECFRIGSLPSAAFGMKRCSAKYKGDPQRWWIAKQPWAVSEWDAGRKLVKVLGYDADETRRVLRAKAKANPWEAARFECVYPLHDAGLDRDDCIDLIRSEGLPIPPKSACTFCPNNTLAEWEELRRDEPEAFADAVAMSRNARLITDPDTVGLMRCNRHGERQLHVWADGAYVSPQQSLGFDEAEAMPCECAL